MNRGQDQNQTQQDFGDGNGHSPSSSRCSTPTPSPTPTSRHRRSLSRSRGRVSTAHSTMSLLDSMERRTQRTYRYGIGLVCVGATLNWLGFAQGHGYVDPLRYLGVACVISGSFCVCMAMCRWLGKPVAASRRVSRLQTEDHGNGDVHIINVSVPSMYLPHVHQHSGANDQVKPPDYDIVVRGSDPGGAGVEPPPYDEAIKLNPGSLPKPFPTAAASSPPPVPAAHMHMQRERARSVRPAPVHNSSNNNYFRRSTISTSTLYQTAHEIRRPGAEANLNVKASGAPMPIVSSSSCSNSNSSSLLCLANANACNNNNLLNPAAPPPPYKSTEFSCYDLPLETGVGGRHDVVQNATTTRKSSSSSHARRLSLESLRSKSTFIP